MQGRKATSSALAGVLALALTACVDQGSVDEVKGRVDLLSAKVGAVQGQQAEILKKLEALSAGQKQILAKSSAPAKPSRPAEDPNKVYDLPVGKSFPKGAENPRLTLVEFSDFQ